MGLVTYMGETHQGRHEPLVDPALFHRVQEILDKRSPQGTRDSVLLHYPKGLLYCGRCHTNGAALGSCTQKPKAKEASTATSSA
jgi:hypothetical protein